MFKNKPQQHIFKIQFKRIDSKWNRHTCCVCVCYLKNERKREKMEMLEKNKEKLLFSTCAKAMVIVTTTHQLVAPLPQFFTLDFWLQSCSFVWHFHKFQFDAMRFYVSNFKPTKIKENEMLLKRNKFCF